MKITQDDIPRHSPRRHRFRIFIKMFVTFKKSKNVHKLPKNFIKRQLIKSSSDLRIQSFNFKNNSIFNKIKLKLP